MTFYIPSRLSASVLVLAASVHADSNPLLRRDMREDTEAPTPVPSQLPTYIDATQCSLQIGTWACDALVAATGVQPVEGCDCYQFCGDTYMGCCAMDEPCSLAGCDFMNLPVAGCRLDGVVDPEEDPTCTFGEHEYHENEPLTHISPGCSGDDDFDCVCSSLFEPDNNGLLCPFCQFETNDGSIVCARHGEDATFVGVDEIEVTCSCTYLGELKYSVHCEIVDQPPTTCALQSNTNQCAELTEYVNPDPDCDCYNFCQGGYSNCCKYGEDCAANCVSGTSTAEIVAGCEIDPNKPVVTHPPSTEPTSAPTETPRCPIELNVEACATLTPSTVRVEGCDCYNYCDSGYSGCCAMDDFECSLSCSSNSGDTPVMTAGCQLPAECKGLLKECDNHSDCCSSRCYLGRCRNPTGTQKDSKVKLSTGRGGAGGASKLRLRRLSRRKSKVRGM